MRARRAAAVAALLAAFGCRAPVTGESVSDGRYVMGTVLEIELPDAGVDREARTRALERGFDEAVALDHVLSRFDPASDVSRLNAGAGGAPMPVDPRARELLGLARDAAPATFGAFDVTVGPVVALWTEAAARGTPPDADARVAAVARVGARRIRLADDGRVALDRGTSLDLGGVAKGFALDRIASDLRASGVESGLLSFGQSSVHALGAPPGDDGWHLLLRSPDGGFSGVVSLVDRALSVSSSLDPSTEIGGVRYGHVVDPRSGAALSQRRHAAVVSRSATTAEVLSTALLVLSDEEGRDVVASHGAEAFVVDADGQGWQSPGWLRETRFAPVDRGR